MLEFSKPSDIVKSIHDLSPCLNLVCGKIRQGKSTLIEYIVSNSLNKYTVIIFSPTIFNGSWSKVGVHADNQFETLDFNKIRFLMNENKKKSVKTRVPYMLILDDCLALTGRNSDEFIGILSILRHLNFTVFLISQTITKIPNIVRSNADFIYLFKLQGLNSIKVLYEEICNSTDIKKDFANDFEENTNNYKFVFVNNTITDGKNRITWSKIDKPTGPKTVKPISSIENKLKELTHEKLMELLNKIQNKQ